MPSTATIALKRAELPLVLLAAVSLPDEDRRRDLRHRLDHAIEECEPLYTNRQLRTVFRRLQRNRKHLPLPDPLRELAIRVARLVFTRLPTRGRERLLIGRNERHRGADGFLIDRALKIIPLHRSAYTRHRLNRLQADCRLIAAHAWSRLEQFNKREPLVRAVCRCDDRLLIELSGQLPWSRVISLQLNSSWLGTPGQASNLSELGFQSEVEADRVRLWPSTPEAIIRFSASLARGDSLWLRANRNNGMVGLRLRDPGNTEVTLQVVVSNNRAEQWLLDVPSPPLQLTDADRSAIAKWAYPLDSWLDRELMEELV